MPEPSRGAEPFKIKIPPLTTTFAEVMQLYRGDESESDVERLQGLVERDAAVSAYVLKVVNSAYFGLQREVSQIDRAITLLGFKPVCNIVMSVGLRETFAQLDDGHRRGIYDYVMQTSLAAAALARELALELEPRVPDTVFTAGLVHQIGRLVLLFSAGTRYAALWGSGDGGPPDPPLPVEEHDHFGTDYTLVGERVAREWRFPPPLATAIRHHRRPADVQSNMLRGQTYMVASAHVAAEALYARDGGASQRFFGMSAPLAALARQYDRPPRALIDALTAKREEVRIYADSILRAA